MSLPDHTFIDVHTYREGSLHAETIAVSTEYALSLMINGAPLATIACSASDIEYLALGHLIADGIISSPDDLRSLDIDRESLKVNALLDDSVEYQNTAQEEKILTGGGRSRKTMPPQSCIRKELPDVKASVICETAEIFLHSSSLHELTHGVHAAALYDLSGRKVVFFDEIGRHNAIDKVIGFAAQEKFSLNDKIIFSTGRISSEIAGKIIQCGIPVFVSRAAPTDYAVRLLKKFNVLSLCRARGNGFTVLHGNEFIKT